MSPGLIALVLFAAVLHAGLERSGEIRRLSALQCCVLYTGCRHCEPVSGLVGTSAVCRGRAFSRCIHTDTHDLLFHPGPGVPKRRPVAGVPALPGHGADAGGRRRGLVRRGDPVPGISRRRPPDQRWSHGPFGVRRTSSAKLASGPWLGGSYRGSDRGLYHCRWRRGKNGGKTACPTSSGCSSVRGCRSACGSS